MEQSNLEAKLNELVEEVGGKRLCQKKVSTLAKKAYENHKKLERSANTLQESLDYLRICIKYQLFDLEATRRENEYLKKLLEERS